MKRQVSRNITMIKIKKGNCLELMKELQDNSIDMILCDLPYGVTNCEWDNILDLKLLWSEYERIIKDNGAIVLFGIEPFSSKLRLSNIKYYKYDWIWEKTQATGHLNVNRQPLRAYENILVFYKKQPLYIPQKTTGHEPLHSYTKYVGTQNNSQIYGKVNKQLSGGGSTERFPRNVIKFSSDKQKSKLHPTQKPIALLEYLIKTYTKENEKVLDNCMGSGSTGVACINTNRDFIGYEIDEKYFEIAQNRIKAGVKNESKRR